MSLLISVTLEISSLSIVTVSDTLSVFSEGRGAKGISSGAGGMDERIFSVAAIDKILSIRVGLKGGVCRGSG